MKHIAPWPVISTCGFLFIGRITDCILSVYPFVCSMPVNNSRTKILRAKLMDCFQSVNQSVHLAVSFFSPARRYASAGNRDCNVSVCLSVTRRYCVKTKKASVIISSPSGSTMILVFWRQISSQNSKGFPRTGASKKGAKENSAIF